MSIQFLEATGSSFGLQWDEDHSTKVKKLWYWLLSNLTHNLTLIPDPIHTSCVFICSFFTKLNQLTYLNLSGNSFVSLPAISGCPLLKTLLLHSNQLSSLPSVLVFPHLQFLDLSCNQFETLPKVRMTIVYSDELGLVYYWMGHPLLQLASFSRLQQLDLSGNTSLSINMGTAKELQWVICQHCFYSLEQCTLTQPNWQLLLRGGVRYQGEHKIKAELIGNWWYHFT